MWGAREGCNVNVNVYSGAYQLHPKQNIPIAFVVRRMPRLENTGGEDYTGLINANILGDPACLSAEGLQNTKRSTFVKAFLPIL